MILTGPTVHLENAMLEQGSLVIEGSLIKDILPGHEQAFPSGHEILAFPADFHLVPGMIDLHIHGVAGADVMDATPMALSTLCRELPHEGTTSFLATTLSGTSADIEAAIINVRQHVAHPPEGAELLGIHLEGPFLAPHKAGAQSVAHFLKPDRDLLAKWHSLSGNLVRQVTFSPERCDDAGFIPWLKAHDIIASMGHTAATHAEAKAALLAGCQHATHLFNAMTGLNHRDPGVVGAILASDTATAELIADGIHLHPEMVRMAYRLMGDKRLALVTDAMRAKCLPDGEYELGGQTVTVRNRQARLADGTLAGSVLRMIDAAHNMRRFTQCDLPALIRMTAENPARWLKIFDRKGSIARGKDADLLVLDQNLRIVMTLCRGIPLKARSLPVDYSEGL